MKHLILLVILFNITACHQTPKRHSQNVSSEIKFNKQGTLKITDSTGQTKANFDIEFAKDDYHRETGLMYRKSMEDGQAMLFIFENIQPRYFWMKNTYIPLDIIYIGPDKKIVSIVKNAKALDKTSLPSKLPAQYVLEINAGLSDQYQLKKGDKVDWEEVL